MKRTLTFLACWAACVASATNQFRPPPPYNGPAAQWGGWAWTSLSNDGTHDAPFSGSSSTLDYVADMQRSSSAQLVTLSGRRGQGSATALVRSRVSATRLGVRTDFDAIASADAGFGSFFHGGEMEAYAYNSVPFMVTAPGLAPGDAGRIVVPLVVTGGALINASGVFGFAAPGYGSIRYYLQLDVSGRVQRNPVCSTNYDFCWSRSINAGHADLGASPTGIALAEFDFRAGQWSSYGLQMILRSNGMAAATGSHVMGGSAQSFVNAGFDMYWGGVTGVFDAQGNPVANWSIQSLPGVDLSVSAIPEPGTWALMLLGAVVIAARIRRACADPR